MNSEIKQIKIIDLNQLYPIHTFWDRIKFHCANQTETESTSEWLQRLNALARPCCYEGDTSAFLIERFILGLRENTWNQLLALEKDKKYITFKDIFELAQRFQSEEPSSKIKHEGGDTSWIKEETNHVEIGYNDVMPEIVYCEAIAANPEYLDSSINDCQKSLTRKSTRKSLKKEEQDLRAEENILFASNVGDTADAELLVPCGVRTKVERRPRSEKSPRKCPKKAALEPKKRQENQLVAVHIENTSNPGTSNSETSDTNKTKKGSKSQPVKKLECDYCHSKWTYRTQLVRHMWTHAPSGRPFMCQYCGKQFTDIQNLTIHLQVHTGERPFKCKLCDKSFGQKNKLKKHQLTHTGIKRFSCTVCGRAFAQKYNLTAHYLIHMDEKPFKCHICGKGYNQVRSLKTHMNNHSKLDL